MCVLWPFLFANLFMFLLCRVTLIFSLDLYGSDTAKEKLLDAAYSGVAMLVL